MTDRLRSGQLAAAAGVNPQTLRYYERRGLLPVPERSPGGHREYGPEAARLLRVIKTAQRLGFTLDEIAQLLDISAHRGPRPGLRSHAEAKLAEIDAKIAHLATIRATLAEVVVAGCSDLTDCSCTAACPIPFTALDLSSAAPVTTAPCTPPNRH